MSVIGKVTCSGSRRGSPTRLLEELSARAATQLQAYAASALAKVRLATYRSGAQPSGRDARSRGITAGLGATLVALATVALAHTAQAQGAAPQVETLSPTTFGAGMTLNGRIQPRGEAASYFFEYRTRVGEVVRTQVEALPPRLQAHYAESWSTDPAGWFGGMTGAELKWQAAEGPDSDGFLRFAEPSGLDSNHLDGIGYLQLAAYFYPGTHPAPGGFNAMLSGGRPDLRDAKVTFRVRGNDWNANGSELVWWTQSDHDVALQRTANWRRANWAYTGHSFDGVLQSGAWETVTYTLINNSSQWTYAGNYVAQKRPNYAYLPLNRTQADVNTDWILALAFVDPRNPPTGSIDFDYFELAYRNHSLLVPSNGGRVVIAPTGIADLATLTDGWRHGSDREWYSAAHPEAPIELVYQLENEAVVTTVQLHQSQLWPSQDVELLLSIDGTSWTSVLRRELPAASAKGQNFAFAIAEKLRVPAKMVKVVMHSGYHSEHWGLGEVEVFGTGAVMATDDDWYSVNVDVGDLEPGETYTVRLGAIVDGEVTLGAQRSFTAPVGDGPHVVTGSASRVKSTSARLDGRMNALGERTAYYFEYGVDSNYGQRTVAQYGGEQLAPRSVPVEVAALQPSCTYHFRLVAENALGRSYGDDSSFTTTATPRSARRHEKSLDR